MEQDIHEYEGEDITVTYDVKRCIHAQECVHGLPEVFDRDERPWVVPDNADADDVADVVTRCPTGALHFEREDGGWEESVPDQNVVSITPDGPLYVRGDVEITDEDGTVLLSDTRVALCRCGGSDNKPLCDDSHRDIDFEAAGSVTGESADDDGRDGGLQVVPREDGPLHVEGPVEIRGESDGSSYLTDDAWLCRCGKSGDKPFCDGTHKKVGFRSEDD